MKTILLVSLLLILTLKVNAILITSTVAGGLWSNGATWDLGVPGPGDDVRIANGATVTLDGNFSCLSLNLLTGNLTSTVDLDGFNLSVSGTITITASANNGINKIINVGSGTLNGASLSMTTSGGNTRDCIVQISTGTVNILGNISMPSSFLRHHIDFTGNGTVNVGGNVTTAGGFTPFAGCTVHYNGAGNQTCGGAYNYANLIFSGGGLKTVGGVTTASGNVTVQNNIDVAFTANSTIGGNIDVQNTSTINCNGTITVTGNTTLQGATAFNTASTATFTGALNLLGTSQFTPAAATTINVGGNWNNSSANADPFVQGTTRVIFNGNAGTQVISNSSGIENFYQVTINNTSPIKPALQSTCDIDILEDYDHTAGFLDLLGNDFTTAGASTAVQTFSLSGGGLFSSIPGSAVNIISSALNNLRIDFIGFSIGETTSEEINITIECENSYFTNSIFYGPMVVTKTGTGGNDTQGGNIFYGPITFNTIVGGDRWRMAHTNPDIFHNLTVNHDGNSNFILGRQTVGNEYHGTTNLNSSTAGGLFIGRNNHDFNNSHEFFGPVNVSVTFTGNINFAESNNTTTSTCIFHDVLTLNSTLGSTGNIRFGSIDYGSTTFLPGAQLTTGSLEGTTTVQLYRVDYQSLMPLDIISNDDVTITCGVTNVGNFNNFNGEVTFSAPNMAIRNSTFNEDAILSAQNFLFQTSTFNGVTMMTKTNGATANATNGGNVFNGDVTFTHNGTGQWSLGSSPAGDDYNGDVTYLRMNAGLLSMASTNTSTFAGNISTVGSSSNPLIATVLTGVAELDGNANQIISGDIARSPLFGRMRINKTGGDVTLAVPINISSDINLTSGIMNTDATNLLIVNNGATRTGGSDASHVNGPMRKVGTNAFEFPVGKGSFWRPISITGPGAAADHFTAEFFNTDPDAIDAIDPAPIDVGITNISDCEHWILDRTNGASNVNVTLSYRPYGANGCSGVADLSALTIARWDGAMWVNHPGTAFGNPSGSITTNAPVTSFSPFALATTSNSNPLPIELVYFSAKANGNQVDLEWQTASEINNDFFTIERSKDGLEFEIVTTVKGAGNSTALLNYKTVDTNPYSGTSFYRLKQTDFDGAFEYSEVRRIEIEGDGVVNVYPNPVLGSDERFIVDVSGFQNGADEIIILDALGKIVYSKSENLRGQVDVETSIFNSGIYFVRVVVGENLYHKKVVLK